MPLAPDLLLSRHVRGGEQPVQSVNPGRKPARGAVPTPARRRLAAYLWACLLLVAPTGVVLLVAPRPPLVPGKGPEQPAGARARLESNTGRLRPASLEPSAGEVAEPLARSLREPARAGNAQAARPDPVSDAAPPVERSSSLDSEQTSGPVDAGRRRSSSRRISLSSFAPWSQPGLCGTSEAALVRETLVERFRPWDGGGNARFHLDPRLGPEAADPVLRHLEWAEHEVFNRLGIEVARPEVFVYLDKQLLKAAGCINEDVVAYYDGALHVVADQPDERESVLHEYTHHALISSGMLGPAWAQEGIAMHIARETWWLDARWLEPLAADPLPLDEMDRAIPYRLPAERAVLFYVQSAALVGCVVEARNWRLSDLYEALRGGAELASGMLDYDLPELQQSSFVHACLAGWIAELPRR